MIRRLVERVVMRGRRVLYRRGHRPQRGSIWYSPSLEMMYGFKDAHYRGMTTELTHTD